MNELKYSLTVINDLSKIKGFASFGADEQHSQLVYAKCYKRLY